MDDDLKANLEDMAREEGRSLNNLINFILRYYLASCKVIKGTRRIRRKEKEDGKK